MPGPSPLLCNGSVSTSRDSPEPDSATMLGTNILVQDQVLRTSAQVPEVLVFEQLETGCECSRATLIWPMSLKLRLVTGLEQITQLQLQTSELSSTGPAQLEQITQLQLQTSELSSTGPAQQTQILQPMEHTLAKALQLVSIEHAPQDASRLRIPFSSQNVCLHELIKRIYSRIGTKHLHDKRTAWPAGNRTVPVSQNFGFTPEIWLGTLVSTHT